jgi:hypothetical protein
MVEVRVGSISTDWAFSAMSGLPPVATKLRKSEFDSFVPTTDIPWEPQSPSPDSRRQIESSGGTSCFSGASGGVERWLPPKWDVPKSPFGANEQHGAIGRHTLL